MTLTPPQLCHLLVEGELLVCVYSAREVSAGEELTLPFDFQFEHWWVHVV